MHSVKDILDKLDSQYVIKKSNFINEFLWTCAGVNKKILRQCPNDYAKYTGVGGTILFTALMAALSGGYAMFFVFNSFIVALLFGIFWGTLIFNLDRFIINSMKIDDSEMNNTLTWKKLKIQLPRLIMAIFLGIVISMPLEMKIFSDRIETQLIKDNIEHINSAKNISTDHALLTELSAEQSNLLKERKLLNDELLKAQKELKEEAEGNALSGKAGHGTIYHDKEIYVQDCQAALTSWDKNNQTHLQQLESRITQLNSSVSHFNSNVSSLQEDGFVARYEAFSNLKSANTTLSVMSWMITILFIIIEIIPTLFKLVMPRCMYTELCDQEEDILKNIYQAQQEELKLLAKNMLTEYHEQKSFSDIIDTQNTIQENIKELNSKVSNIDTQFTGEQKVINEKITKLNQNITNNLNNIENQLSELNNKHIQFEQATNKQIKGIVDVLQILNKNN